MKLLTLLLAALLSITVSAGFFGGTQVALDEDDNKVPGENPLQHCQDPKDDILTLESVDLDPNPPQPGKTLAIVGNGTLRETVEKGAKINLQVKYGLITLIKQTADLCETVKNVDLECPLEEGPLTIKKEVDLPKAIPPGKYHVTADVISKDEEKITCLEATVEFKRGGGDAEVKQGL